MPIPKVRIETTYERIFSPFTGQPVETDDGLGHEPSTLFVYYGDAGEYAYVSPDLVRAFNQKGVECAEDDLPFAPDEVAEKLDLPACFMREIDSGWNGVNYYCFSASVGSD